MLCTGVKTLVNFTGRRPIPDEKELTMAEATPNGSNNGGQPNPNPSNLDANGNPITPAPNGGEGGKAPEGGDGKTIPVESYNVVASKLREANAKLKEFEDQKKANEDKSLAEQGKFKELHEKAENEKKELQAKFDNLVKTDKVKTIATKLGANNADVVVRLLDLGKIKLSEDGSVDEGEVTKLVEALKSSDAYLFGGQQPANPVGNGSGGSPEGGDGGVKKFRRSQLRDSKFYQANEKDILIALRTGNIIEDIDNK